MKLKMASAEIYIFLLKAQCFKFSVSAFIRQRGPLLASSTENDIEFVLTGKYCLDSNKWRSSVWIHPGAHSAERTYNQLIWYKSLQQSHAALQLCWQFYPPKKKTFLKLFLSVQFCKRFQTFHFYLRFQWNRLARLITQKNSVDLQKLSYFSPVFRVSCKNASVLDCKNKAVLESGANTWLGHVVTTLGEVSAMYQCAFWQHGGLLSRTARFAT